MHKRDFVLGSKVCYSCQSIPIVGAFFSAWTRAKELVTDNSNESNYFAEKNQTIAYLGYGV